MCISSPVVKVGLALVVRGLGGSLHVLGGLVGGGAWWGGDMYLAKSYRRLMGNGSYIHCLSVAYDLLAILLRMILKIDISLRM